MQSRVIREGERQCLAAQFGIAREERNRNRRLRQIAARRDDAAARGLQTLGLASDGAVRAHAESGAFCEPIEEVVIDADEDNARVIVQSSPRKGEMIAAVRRGRVRLVFYAGARRTSGDVRGVITML